MKKIDIVKADLEKHGAVVIKRRFGGRAETLLQAKFSSGKVWDIVKIT